MINNNSNNDTTSNSSELRAVRDVVLVGLVHERVLVHRVPHYIYIYIYTYIYINTYI